MNKHAKYQVRTESRLLVACSESRSGIDAFLEQVADGTDAADYEVLSNSSNSSGGLTFIVRAAA